MGGRAIQRDMELWDSNVRGNDEAFAAVVEGAAEEEGVMVVSARSAAERRQCPLCVNRPGFAGGYFA